MCYGAIILRRKSLKLLLTQLECKHVPVQTLPCGNWPRSPLNIYACVKLSKIWIYLYNPLRFFLTLQVQCAVIITSAVVLYLLTFYQLWLRKSRVGNLHQGPQEARIAKLNKETKRFAVMMMLVLTPFTVTWVSLNIFMYAVSPAQIIGNSSIFISYTVFTHLLGVNSFINPVVYAWINLRYRKGYIKILTFGKYESVSSTSSGVVPAPAPAQNVAQF